MSCLDICVWMRQRRDKGAKRATQNRKKRDLEEKWKWKITTFSVFVTLGAQECACLLKMFRSNCIFTGVRGQTLLSSAAEVKLIFSFVFDVKVPSPPPLLLLPRPQHTRRMAIFHLPSCCLLLLAVTVLLFLSSLPAFIAWLLSLSPSLHPSSLSF